MALGRSIEVLDLPTDSGLQPNWCFLRFEGRDGVAARRVPNAQIPRPGENDDKEWPHRPDLKPAHQELRQPEGFGVIYRPVCGARPGERYEISLRARLVDAPAEGRLVVWLATGRPSTDSFDGPNLGACEARLKADGYTRIGSLGGGEIPVGWVELSSAQALPGGFLPAEGRDKFHVVVAIENMGPGAVHLDWLTVTRRAP